MAFEVNRIIQGDCLVILAGFPDASIDACVTDPPYGLTSIQKRFGKEGSAPAQFGKDGSFARLSKGFMGKVWDGSGIEYSVDLWREVLRVLKPGGHLLAFGGSRTYHRLACAIENAGFEIRDQIMWVYGSGFPKSLNIGKAVDGWGGWGTALKPAHEPICVARKPLDGTVAANVLKWGTGGINIDGCRVGIDGNDDRHAGQRTKTFAKNGEPVSGGEGSPDYTPDTQGRFPANLIHDGSDEVMAGFPNTKSGSIKAGRPNGTSFSIGGELGKRISQYDTHGDSGSAARFFYCAKASKAERDAGCEGKAGHNHHPTVKPLALMRYLITLVSRDDQIILDPFAGSGSTLIAAKELGRRYIGIEMSPEYCEIANRRISNTAVNGRLLEA